MITGQGLKGPGAAAPFYRWKRAFAGETERSLNGCVGFGIGWKLGRIRTRWNDANWGMPIHRMRMSTEAGFSQGVVESAS